MSADTSSVLASIDDTLAGYDGVVSSHGDMMRWSPQRVICDGGDLLMPGLKPEPLRRPGYVFGPPQCTSGDQWERIGTYDPAPGGPGFSGGSDRMADAYPLGLQQALRPVEIAISLDTSQFEAALRGLVRALGGLAAATAPPHMAALAHALLESDHRIRCRTCNPAGNPRPLAVDGREYHRRQRARQKRNR